MANVVLGFKSITSGIPVKSYNLGIFFKLGSTILSKLDRSLTTMQRATPESLPAAEAPNKVFVQSNLDKDMITISFVYESDKRLKQFNLYRKATEPLSSSLERIKLNIQKLKTKRLNSKTSKQPAQFDRVDIILDGTTIDPINTKNADAWVEGAVLELDGKSYYVTTNCPGVESILLPSCMMRDYIVMPRISLVNCSIEFCQLTWYRQISSSERDSFINSDPRSESQIDWDGRNYWYKLSSNLTYCPTADDVGHQLKLVCLPSDGIKIGLNYSCLSSGPVELGPSNCPFERRHSYTRDKLSKPDEFRFVTYNILADLYADSDYSRSVLFAHCPPHALDIDYRRQLLLKEIVGYNADLICLQEVDKKEFIRTYGHFLQSVANLSSVFDTKGGQVAEGLATFYSQDKFELIDAHKTLLSDLIGSLDAEVTDENSAVQKDSIEDEEGTAPASNNDNIKPHPILDCSEKSKDCLPRFSEIRSAILQNKHLMKRFVDRHTVMQTSLFKCKKSPNKYILVANTHLYFAPDADHIRLLQGSVCVKYLEYLKNFYNQLACSESSKPIISIIFCGDMNSTPDCGLFKLLHEGRITKDLPDWLSNPEEAVVNLNIETILKFRSAYADIEYTNFTPLFNGCLDYIYYETDGLTCESTVPLPDHQDVIAIGGIPSDVFPSDHLALIANLKLSDIT